MPKEIQLVNGGVTLVDESDYEFLNQYRWYRDPRGYVLFGEGRDGIKSFQKMHRLIMDAQPGQYVDHKDRNKSNNQRSNLRFVSVLKNAHNHPKKAGKNKFIGVQFIPRLQAYQSRCRINGSDFFLGYYKTEEAAAYAYNIKARELSDHATLNQLESDEPTLQKMLAESRIAPKSSRLQSKYKFIYFKPKSVNARGSDSWYVRIAKMKLSKFYLPSEEAAYSYLVENWRHHFPAGYDFLREV